MVMLGTLSHRKATRLRIVKGQAGWWLVHPSGVIASLHAYSSRDKARTALKAMQRERQAL